MSTGKENSRCLIEYVRIVGKIWIQRRNAIVRRKKMKTGVTKEQFIKSLEQTLKLTRAGVESLELADEETVVIHYEGGGKRPVNIALDSATAIIRGVARVVD